MKINTENKVFDSFRDEVIKEIKEDNKYNGWSNYETWVFKSWIDNDYQLYKHVQTLCSNRYELKLVENLERLANEMTEPIAWKQDEPVLTGLASDLLGRALKRINYHEIADVMVQDYKNELDYESNDKEVL